ncbi:MAG: enoyl-CoA hydratase [Dehalococcoidia bacterium]
MELHDVSYAVDGPIAVVTLNRPQYRNAQSWRLLDELDQALDQAAEDRDVKVVVVRGEGGNFSSGHDLGTPEQVADRQARGVPDVGIEYYDNFRKYNLDYTLKWRNHPKPTIAMVEGYCIFGGWMIAASMDIIFAARDARFLAGLVEYFSIPWDIGPRKTKEIIFESRFITAEEAHELGFVNRVFEPADLERETMLYAQRVAENSSIALRLGKLAVNHAQDVQGFTAAMEAGLHDYMIMAANRGGGRVEGERRLVPVDLAVRGLRGERPGLTPPDPGSDPAR